MAQSGQLSIMLTFQFCMTHNVYYFYFTTLECFCFVFFKLMFSVLISSNHFTLLVLLAGTLYIYNCNIVITAPVNGFVFEKYVRTMWDCNSLFSFNTPFFTNSVCQHYCRATVCPARHCCQTCQSVTRRHRAAAAFNMLMSELVPITH